MILKIIKSFISIKKKDKFNKKNIIDYFALYYNRFEIFKGITSFFREKKLENKNIRLIFLKNRKKKHFIYIFFSLLYTKLTIIKKIFIL